MASKKCNGMRITTSSRKVRCVAISPEDGEVSYQESLVGDEVVPGDGRQDAVAAVERQRTASGGDSLVLGIREPVYEVR